MKSPWIKNYFSILISKIGVFSFVGFIIINLIPSFYFGFNNNEEVFVASLEINKTVNSSTPQTGVTFVYTLQYRCASLTDDCIGTVITDPLPPEVEFLNVLGSSHTTSEVYDAATHTVTFTFQNALTAGTSGQVQINVRFPNGSTTNGTVASNSATISATNATSVTSSVITTAVASAYPEYEKGFVNGGAPDVNTTYQVHFCNNLTGSNSYGTLILRDITIVDTLPVGAVFVSPNINWRSSYTYEPTSRVLTIYRDSLAPGECMWPRFTVVYPSPTFNVGSSVSNTAYWTYTPEGSVPTTVSDTHTFNLTSASSRMYSYKNASSASYYQGSPGTYEIGGENNGTSTIVDFCINDTIPDGMEVTRFTMGGWYYGGLEEHEHRINAYYTTNLNGPTLVPGSPFSIWDPEIYINVSGDLGLTEGGPEYITSLNFCFGDIPAGFADYEGILIEFRVKSDATPGTRTNCAEMTTSSSGVTFTEECVDVEIQMALAGSVPDPYKSYLNEGNYFNVGETITMTLRPQNGWIAGQTMSNPSVYDLLPPEVDYVPGSWYLNYPNPAGVPNPIFTETPNFNGTGRTLLQWDWTGAASHDFAPNSSVWIYFDVVVNNTAYGGPNSFYNEMILSTEEAAECWGDDYVDIYDLDNDGNTTELFCANSVGLNVNSYVSLESEKLVKGQLDTVWTKYPATGYTVPGGLADYQLTVRNKGNIQLDNIVVIDILPFVGDEGVIDLNFRNSRWRPNLVGSVSAPVGVTVYYSTEGNPCRSAEQIEPSGPASCNTANWTSVPPSDITTVQSLKFEFGSNVLNPNDSLVLEWPMRAPVNALATIGAQPDSIAWNSFGYIGQRVDNNDYLLATEPIKVGISMNTSVPAVIGDFVWFDNNQNGLQNGGEPGYDGMRVELFQDNGDGNADPNTDTYINFTVTANGGYYLFPYLPSGDYFLVFYKPAPYGVTTADTGGNDAIDSDGTLMNYNGFTVAVTAVTNLSGIEYDLDWDLGIYPNGLAAIGNYVWADSNNDGIQNEPSSNGINGVTVNLYDNLNPGIIYATDITSNDINGNSGYYLFDQLPPGDYFVEFVLPASTTFSSQGSSGSSDPLDSDANSTTGRTEVFSLAADVYDDTWDAALILSGTEVCGNGIDDDLDGDTDEECVGISGSVFEDINFGGGDGRNYTEANTSAQASGWVSNAIQVPNARVELYDNAGDFVTSANTNSTGEYLFSNLAVGNYSVRVVNNTISSNRASNITGQTIIPVQTYRTDNITPVINEVGGASPALIDANANTTNANISTLSTASTAAQSVTSITLAVTDVSDIDFGYNFDVVVNTNDAGQGSLRQFILNSNELDNTNLDQEDNPTNGVSFLKDAEWETSIFMIPGGGVHMIQPLSSLPSILDPQTHVTAYSQAGSAQGPVASRTINVALNGNGNNYDGLTIYSSDVQISGFAIYSFRKGIYANRTTSVNNFIWGNYIGTEVDGTTAASNSSSGIDYRNISNSAIGTNGDNINDANEGNVISNSYYGIDTRNGSNLLIAGNYIGLDKTGTADFGNQYVGVYLGNATGPNYVGFKDDLTNTNATHFRNVIGGNGNDAVRIADSDNQVVAGNYLGTDVTGTIAIENENYGIQLQGVINNNIIGTNSNGDDDLKERNIISGNGTGLRFLGSSSGSGNIIAGNFIGTDVSGNAPLPNQNNGIDLSGIHTGTIVGTNGDNVNDAIEGNVISGNTDDGMRLGIDNAIVAGNNIGVGYDGMTILGNGGRGILLTLTSSDNVIGYAPSMINSNELIVGNKIMNNDDAGVGLSGTGTQNRISRNQLADNSGLGIDLDYDLVTANDNGDGDTGTNNLLNFPVLESARVVGNNLIVRGFAPAGSEVEFFIADAGPNPNPLPSGYTSSFGEGADYLFSFNEGSVGDTDLTTANYIDDGTGAVSTKTQNRFEITIDTAGFNLTNGIDLTSTATDTNDNTSEFSGWMSVEYIEVCNDGVDNDGDGDEDCDDSDCITDPEINISQNIACINEVVTISSSDIGAGTTYTWDFGTNANPATASGIGPHNVSYTSCGGKTISLTVQKNACSITVDSIVNIIDSTDPVWDIAPQDLILECQPSANYTDSIALWLSNYGYGAVSDNCNSLSISNDYSGLTADCGSTGSTTVQFTAIDSCGNSAMGTANIQILDTQAPEISNVIDIAVDCNNISTPVMPTIIDSCDSSVDIVFSEVTVHHPNGSWKSIVACELLYTVSDVVYDDKGTGSTADDEMTFIMTVIGQNVGGSWNTTINGTPINGDYYKTYEFGPILSNGSLLSFSVVDVDDAACNIMVNINAADF